MRNIMIIEPSATIRRVINRLLRDDFKLCETSDFATGVAQLNATKNPSNLVDGILFHWPIEPDPDATELMRLLATPTFQQIAVLMLADQATAENMDWITKRGHSALIHWDNYKEINSSLTTVMDSLHASEIKRPAREIAQSIRILIVDDSRTVRVKFSHLLNQQGYKTTAASSVQEAIELAEKGSFDIAVIDFFMPDENGDQLCKAFKSNPATAGISCAIMTGTYLDTVITASLEAGAEECMFKNEADNLFLARIAAMSRSILIRRNTEREHQRLDGILESVGDGVYGVDTEGQITFINPSARRLLGYDNHQRFLGQLPENIFFTTQADHDNESKKRAIGSMADELESTFICKDGSHIQVELTIRPLHIEAVLVGAVVAFRDISERKILEEELTWHTNHDSLTKLYNRKFFEESLELEIFRLQRSEEKSALLYLDLDRFKYVNDTAGHIAGDQLLAEISAKLNSRLRSSDMLARIGGDEFAFILRQVNAHNVLQIADQFREILAHYSFNYKGRSFDVNGSIGIALIDKSTLSSEETLTRADTSCHIAKRSGRNQCHLYVPEADDAMHSDVGQGWSSQLTNALNNDTFALFLQPIVAIDTAVLAHPSKEPAKLYSHLVQTTTKEQLQFEVLLRLYDSSGRPVSPNAFLPTAERFSMTAQIDTWVIKAALKALADLHNRGIKVQFSINLSAQSIMNEAFPDAVKKMIQQSQVDPTYLIFEITENIAITNQTAAQNCISKLKTLGCHFSLDDFGSSLTTFSQLKELPVDYIKIDGPLIKEVANDATNRSIIKAICEIAHSIDKKTVAESVEDVEIIETLRECGVDYIQGYAVAQPTDIKDCFTREPIRG
jgi:diguanylate cyclase (GGDEF)-like protein/PAS domain S-box-containing protein